MASKRKPPKSPKAPKSPVVLDLTPAILVQIRDQLSSVQTELHAFRDEVRTRLDLLDRRVALLESRFDHHLDNIEDSIRDIRTFLAVYGSSTESKLAKLEGLERLESRVAQLETLATFPEDVGR